MISQIKQKGFTIVELLIVIVIIAILAAISMAAYTNITARANNSTAAATATTVKDVANAYNSANAGFPTTRALFISGGADPVAKMPSDIIFVAADSDVTAATNPKTVRVVPYGGTPIQGFRIIYKDFTTGTTKTETVGDVSGAAGTQL